MPAARTGNAASFTRKKKGTASQNRFRFESFSQRIASLTINPVSKARTYGTDELNDGLPTSHFITSFDKWRELNLSAHFVQFVRDIEPLSETLPQILHYQDQLVDHLVSSIDNGDFLSLEPLLELTSALAHDLGYQFERHFPRVLQQILSAAVTHKEAEVIEWAFSALAWLLKYLSRLLVPDIRPTFDAVAPYLGKTHGKAHIARFAAEALSFLIRKAGSRHDDSALATIVEHILQDAADSSNDESGRTYQYGLMNLFANSIKGVDHGLHSCGLSVFETLLAASGPQDSHVVVGVFINLIHCVNPESLVPVLSSISNYANAVAPASAGGAFDIANDLLFYAAATRQGAKVSEWAALLDSADHLLSVSPDHLSSATFAGRLAERSAVTLLAAAPLNLVIPHLQLLLKLLLSQKGLSIATCMGFFQEQNQDRLESLLLSHLGELLAETNVSYQERLIMLHTLLPTLQRKQLQLPDTVVSAAYLLDMPTDQPLNPLSTWSLAEMHRLHAYLDLIPTVPLDGRVRALILQELDLMMTDDSNGAAISGLVLGNGLRALIETGLALHSMEQSDRFLELCFSFRTTPSLLENLRTWAIDGSLTIEQLQRCGFFPGIYKNLESASKSVRHGTLRLLRSLLALHIGEESDLLDATISIEELTSDVQSARKMAMYVRQLSVLSESLDVSSWLRHLAEHFYFGMMNYQLADAWSAAIEGLRSALLHKSGEEMITTTLSEWLSDEANMNTGLGTNRKREEGRYFANEFQCFKAERTRKTFEVITNQINTPSSYLEQNFNSSIQGASASVSPRSQALRILKGLPQLAEKRSRHLVPLFLEWTKTEDTDAGNEDEDTHPELGSTSRADLHLFLDMLVSFQNPKSLYRSAEVYDRLLELLASSNAAIQTRALDAILTWKQQAVRGSSEVLHHLLDESRFREALVDFFQPQTTPIQSSGEKRELMIVLMHLLFGRMTASLKSSGSSNQKARRRAVLDCFHTVDDGTIDYFLSVAIRSVNSKMLQDTDPVATEPTTPTTTTHRRLLGLLMMIKDMLVIMGDRISFLAEKLFQVILYSARATKTETSDKLTAEHAASSSLIASVRTQALQSLVLVFDRIRAPELRDHVDNIFKLMISPRLENLAVENAQSVSHLFELFAVWASSPELHAIILKDPRVLSNTAETLQLPFAKEDVKLFILDRILSPLLKTAQTPLTSNEIDKLQPHFIACCHSILREDPTRRLLASSIRLLLQLAPSIVEEQRVRSLLEVLVLLVQKPPSQVTLDSKHLLLELMRSVLPYAKLGVDETAYAQIFDSLGGLFAYVPDTSVRLQICSALQILTEKDANLHEVADLCFNLNVNSTAEIDRPDFERRREAFNQICSDSCSGFSVRQWTPVVHNLLYLTKSAEDFDISSNARIALCSVIAKLGPEEEQLRLIPDVLLPALRTGVRADKEDIRRNCLEIMAHTVQTHPEVQEINDLTTLLMNNDEEASIFNNLFHVQQHRRIRALRRLASPEIVGSLASKNVAQFLAPLLEQFVFDRDEDSKAGDIASETVNTIGALAYRMEWPQARAMLRRYTTFISSKPGFEKSTFRLLAVLIDAIVKASQAKEAVNEAEVDQPTAPYPLMQTISRIEKLSADIIENLLPPMTSYLHEKDESVVSLRAPVAISVAKILMILPPEEISLRLPPVLTDICHILRSRAVEARDLVRKTLGEMSLVVGSQYFGFIAKELRAALPQGYQLHVLSFTVHTLLVEAVQSFQAGDIDYCVGDLSSIIMDDIFGASGREKDEEDYSGKMKEVKSRKSFDSMELLASKISIRTLGVLIQPIQALLHEKLDLKTVRKADELLRRFAAGLAKNDAAADQQSLVFCYELVQRAYLDERPKKTARASNRDRFMVNLKGRKAGHYVASGTSYDFKILCFAFDLVRMLVQKFEQLRTPANLAGFLPAIGDAILKAQDEVQVSAMRLLAAIIKVPIPDLDKDGAVHLSEAIRVVKAANALSSELVQAALKLVTAYLRERPDVKFRENDVAQLLKIIGTELDRSESQGLVFNFLKAVLGRCIVLPEVYELMDDVAAMMVTHTSRETRAMARATYLQFLLNYPQGSKRLEKQIGFLRSNLQYPRLEGRQAIMEAIHLLVSRVDQGLQQEIVGTFFNPLVLVLVNDDSAECRKMAALLLESMFKAATEEKADQINSGIAKWLAQTENAVLRRAGFQTYAILLDTAPQRVEQSLRFLRDTVESTIESETGNSEETTWELVYYALQLLSRMLKYFKAFVLGDGSEKLWTLVHQAMSFPHKWVKTIGASLIEIQLSDLAQSTQDTQSNQWPIVGTHGLAMSEEQALLCTKKLLRAMHSPELSEELADHLVRDLVVVARLCQNMESPKEGMNGLDGDDGLLSDDEAEEVEEDDEVKVTEPAAVGTKSALGLVFRQTSLMIRQEPAHSKASALILRAAALRLCTALCDGLPVATLRPHLQDIMLPLYNLVDPSIPTPFSVDQGFRDMWTEQVASSREIMDLLQNRLGSSEFLKESSAIQARVRERRNERRMKRKLAAVTAPERTGREKQRKGERKRERRKEKGMEFRERRRGW